MDDAEKLKQQMTFFDYIYPEISRRLNDNEKNLLSLNNQLNEFKSLLKDALLTIEQYKSKIQRIEQFLIEHGLIKLLGKKIKSD